MEGNSKPAIPRHGYITELAKRCNCSRRTVTRALFEGYKGPKSDLVLSTYSELFNSNEKETNAGEKSAI